jgi:hypothetical protein
MKKTWNVTLFRDGKPVSERHGVSRSDALAQIYYLSRTGVSLETVDEIAAPAHPADTTEMALAAA